MESDRSARRIVLSGAWTESGIDPDRRVSRAFLRVLFPDWTVQ